MDLHRDRGGRVALSESSSAGSIEPSLKSAGRGGGPSPLRGLAVMSVLVVGVGFLASRVDTGEDGQVVAVGRIEVTARLLECPESFPQLGAYRYTYVFPYEVLAVHRADPEGRHILQSGDTIFVGHYQPWLPRSEIKDADWGSDPLGGRLGQFVTGETHRLALEYELQDWAPSGVLDYQYPPGTNRFFAVWANPTTL